MEQLVWYSYNHDCFKSKFGSSLLKNVGEINGFNEELVCVYNLYVKTPRTNFIHKLFFKPKRKQNFSIVYVKKNIRQWWR